MNAEIIPLPMGTLVRYTYPTNAGDVTVMGRKGPAVNPGQNAGFRLVDEDGGTVATITRYARVTVLA